MDGMRGLLRENGKSSSSVRSDTSGGHWRRPTSIGEGRIDHIGDVAGYNGDGAIIPDFQNPGIPNIVSEYGSKSRQTALENITRSGDA